MPAAEAIAGQWIEVFTEPASAHEMRGVGLDTARKLFLARRGEPLTDHHVHHSPDRAAPVALRLKAIVVRCRARDEKARASGPALERGTQGARLVGSRNASPERQQARVRRRVDALPADQVARLVDTNSSIPKFIDCPGGEIEPRCHFRLLGAGAEA